MYRARERARARNGLLGHVDGLKIMDSGELTWLWRDGDEGDGLSGGVLCIGD